MIAFAAMTVVLTVIGFIVLPASEPGADGPRWRPRLIAAVGVAGVVLVLIGLFWLVVTGISCHDGDGGVPYTARDSLFADYCGTGAYWIALGLPVVPLAFGATLTARHGGWRSFWVGLLAGAVMASSPMLASATLPSTCSDEAERQSRAENRPERCEHY